MTKHNGGGKIMGGLNRVYLQGRVMTDAVVVPGDEEERPCIRFALAVARPSHLPRKRRGVNVDHVLVEVASPSDVVRSLISPDHDLLVVGFLRSRKTREAGLVARAQQVSSADHVGINEALVKGYLVDDALLFTTRSNRPKVTFRLAVPRPRGLDGERKDYMSVEGYGDWVLGVLPRLKKSMAVFVHGYLQSRDDLGDAARGWPLSLVALEILPIECVGTDEEEDFDLDMAVEELLQRLKGGTSCENS